MVDCYACKKPIIPKEDSVYHHISYEQNLKVPLHSSCHMKIHKGQDYQHLLPIDKKKKGNRRIYIKFNQTTNRFEKNGIEIRFQSFKIVGLCAIEKRIREHNDCCMVYLPKSWKGSDVVVVLVGKHKGD